MLVSKPKSAILKQFDNPGLKFIQG